MKRLFASAFVMTAAVSCNNGPQKYDGTYQGAFQTTLTPAPMIYGSPSYQSTFILVEGTKGDDVQGSFDGGGLYAAEPQTFSGSITATIDTKDNLNTLSVTIDQLFQACGQMLTANGSGYLMQDPSDSKIERLVWTAEGDGSCAGNQTHFVLGSGDAGIPRTGP